MLMIFVKKYCNSLARLFVGSFVCVTNRWFDNVTDTARSYYDAAIYLERLRTDLIKKALKKDKKHFLIMEHRQLLD